MPTKTIKPFEISETTAPSTLCTKSADDHSVAIQIRRTSNGSGRNSLEDGAHDPLSQGGSKSQTVILIHLSEMREIDKLSISQQMIEASVIRRVCSSHRSPFTCPNRDASW